MSNHHKVLLLALFDIGRRTWVVDLHLTLLRAKLATTLSTRLNGSHTSLVVVLLMLAESNDLGLRQELGSFASFLGCLKCLKLSASG